MKKYDDPREGCELCRMVYGMEDPKVRDLCNSKNCIALIVRGNNKPDFILIFSKTHEMDMDRVKKNEGLYREMAALIRRVKRTLKEKNAAKKFRVTWCDGGMLLLLTGNKDHPLNSVKSHAHCKMDVFYR